MGVVVELLVAVVVVVVVLVSATVVDEEVCVQAEATRVATTKSVMLRGVDFIGRETTGPMANCHGTERRLRRFYVLGPRRLGCGAAVMR